MALAGFSRISVAMVLTDPRAADNPIVYVNEAFERITGYARSAVIGRNCRFLQGDDTARADVERLREAVATGRDVGVDIKNYRADGRPFVNRLLIAPIHDDAGELLYFLGIQRALGERVPFSPEDADEALQHIRALVQDDLAVVLSQIGEAEDAGGYPVAVAIERRVECVQLVYEAIDLAHGRAGGADGIDAGALIGRVGAAVVHEQGRTGIRYQQSVEPMRVNLETAVRIALLVSEMLSNAFVHAFGRVEEGMVELRATHLSSGGLRLIVSDDGTGLPADAPYPDMRTVGGRLIANVIDGLDAVITPVRGGAGTVVMVDVPADVAEP